MTNLNAIIILSGGTISYRDSTGVVRWRSTRYEDHDAYGALGGVARVEAAALLAKKFSQAIIVATSQRLDDGPTHAATIAEELVALGVPSERIIREEKSRNSREQIKESLKLATKRHWPRILFVTNEYQIPRMQAFLKDIAPTSSVEFISAEKVLAEADSSFAKKFEAIKRTSLYRSRLVAEKRGLEAFLRKEYQTESVEKKIERHQ